MTAFNHVNRPSRGIAARTWTGWLAALCVLSAIAQSAQADSTIPWVLKPPPSGMRLEPGRGIAVWVFFPNAVPTQLRVVQTSLLEQTRKFPFAKDGFQICDAAVLQGNCKAPEPTGAGPSSLVIYLHPINGAPTAGHFSGQVTVASSLKPEGETLALDFYTTTPVHYAAGVAVTCASALISWFVAVWMRNRYNRTQLLLPAAFARQRLFRVQAVLEQAPQAVAGKFPQTQYQTQHLLEQLDDAALEDNKYIPPSTPLPIGDPSLRVDDYRHFLAAVDAWLNIIEDVVNSGLRTAWSSIGPSSTPAVVTIIGQAMSDVDKLVTGASAPDATQTHATITTRLTKLNADLTNAGVPPVGGGLEARAGPQSTDSLRIELSRTGKLIWLATILLTTVVGSYVTVISNLGFGIINDYYACVFWGFGLPSGAAMLQQTTQSAYGALGVSVKRQ